MSKTKAGLLIILVVIAVFFLIYTGSVLGSVQFANSVQVKNIVQSADIAQLEARVAELETSVKKLTEESVELNWELVKLRDGIVPDISDRVAELRWGVKTQ